MTLRPTYYRLVGYMYVLVLCQLMKLTELYIQVYYIHSTLQGRNSAYNIFIVLNYCKCNLVLHTSFFGK